MTRRITPVHSEIPVAATGSFEPDGQYPGEAFAYARSVRSWGSWSGSDDNSGTITIGPFPAPRVVRFGIGGYPTHEGNTLHVELADQSASLPIKLAPVGERWEVVDVELPGAWRGRSIRILGRDTGKGPGGWFALTEPVRGGRSDGNNALIETSAAFAINGLLLGLVYLAALIRLNARATKGRVLASANANETAGAPRAGSAGNSSWLPPHWMPLGGAALVAIIGYAAFWVYFVNALAGVIFSWTVIGAAAYVVVRECWRRTTPPPLGTDVRRETGTVLKLMLTVGAFYIALLHLFPTSHDFYTLAANRYREALPSDNMLPHTTAERLFAAESLKNPIDEWLSSDRPPLQAGWQLLTWPASKILKIDRRTGSGTAAVWLQLLWIPAAFGLLRSFGINPRRAAGWLGAMALSGLFLQNTIYTWPKLAAGAFATGAVGVLMFPVERACTRRHALCSGVFASLAWLAHGGVAFSFLAFLPFLVSRVRRTPWRAWLPAAAAVMMLVSPWLVYQTFYDPPAHRLFKWHLAGQSERDPRGTWQTLRDEYARIGWREAWSNKISNFHGQVYGDWNHLRDLSPATAGDRRHQEFFQTGRALTWWPLLALLALVTTRRRVFVPSWPLVAFAAWLLLTIVIWCLLMFGRYQAVIHHGSYALMIGLFVWFSVIIERSGRGWLGALVVLQAVTLGTTWAIGNASINGPAAGLFYVIASAAGVAWFVVRSYVRYDEGAAGVALNREPHFENDAQRCGALSSCELERVDSIPNDSTRSRSQFPIENEGESQRAEPLWWERLCVSLRSWWANPRLSFWVLAALALVLFLRKPHALHTPQLWAEDGSIFLMQADLHGTSALLMPYMGYLHTYPRLVAWLAPHLLDPAWWPAFYNGVSFLVWLAVLARVFSSRLDLPGKPWLAFAMIAVPHTGEVFFNVTNVQWLTAFVLIQQALIRPPVNHTQRVTDLSILALVTLTGPFGIIFLPLFAWRWWRDRRGDNVAAFAVVLLCGAIQAGLVIQTGPRFEFQSAPVNLWAIVVVLARRIVMWPLLGYDVAIALPAGVVGAIGGTFLLAVLAWALRPHARRLLRVQIVAAFLLIVLAAVYRTRPDTWAADNLDYGDRYFYIPRVLLAWLLIWEFDATPRFVANTARVFCVVVLLAHLRTYTVRAPQDYHWASHVEPIRQGVAADLPTLPEGWLMEYRGRPGAQR